MFGFNKAEDVEEAYVEVLKKDGNHLSKLDVAGATLQVLDCEKRFNYEFFSSTISLPTRLDYIDSDIDGVRKDIEHINEKLDLVLDYLGLTAEMSEPSTLTLYEKEEV